MHIHPTEVKKAAGACRRELAAGIEHLSTNNIPEAYAALERAQGFAFDAKSLVKDGGKFIEEES